MTRPLTRTQVVQNDAFLHELRRTGNVREAARILGVHRSTFTKRRVKHPGFAAAWDAALAIASANLHRPDEGRDATAEPRVVRTRAGFQLRRAVAGRLTRDAEQAFLAALSATANIRLAAAAAGFSHSAFYARRKISPGFAREMRLALEMGYERVEMALLAAAMPESHADDGWRHNDPPPIPPMSANQALQLLYLHQKEARLGGTPATLRRFRGEPKAVWYERVTQMGEARLTRQREAYRLAEAARTAGRDPAGDPPTLPALDQVTGWSKAGGNPPHDPTRALFGGWRLKGGKGKGKGG